MNNRRKILIAGAAILAGCAHRITNQNDYEERINALAISPTGDVLVVVGRSFDYIFHPPASLVAVLRSELRRVISANFQNFELDTNTSIHGEWGFLYEEKNGNPKLSMLAESLGFKPDGVGRFVLKGGIRGTRYQKKERANQATNFEKTNQEYKIQVKHSMKYVSSKQLENTPINHSGDGLLLGIIVLLPLILLLDPCITCK